MFKTIDIAYVGSSDTPLYKVLKDTKFDKDVKAFKVKNTTLEDAKKMLEDYKIDGIVSYKNNDFELLLKSRNVNQMILEKTLTSYKQRYQTINTIIKDNPSVINQKWLNDNFNYKSIVEPVQVNKNINNSVVIYFYTVIAMAIMYGAIISATTLDSIQPNVSQVGARLSISPFKKSKMIILDLLATISYMACAQVILLIYLKYVLKIDFGNQDIYIIVIIGCGILASSSFGYLVSLLLKKRTNLKIPIITSIAMFFSFLSGMMSTSIKYLVTTNLPILNFINPVALITDSFYLLFFYNDFSKAYLNIGMLLIMFVLFISISIFILRSDSYESL
jgi:ABC-2 type transport system permease protein